MKFNFLTIILIFIGFLGFSQDHDSSKKSLGQPKIGLVLSGGGAKGLAHIGVLKVLEEVGIPIDFISGTSMGGIIGGLYAIGYSAHDIEKIVLSQDWQKVLTDYVSRQYIPINQKEEIERYVLSFPIKPKGIQLPEGMVEGNNILNLFSRLSYDYHNQNDFRKFPIPFVCIAADIETGEPVIIDKGYLPLAMRASMAIPTVFTPVEIDGRLLVDGGMVDNFPVKEVVKMGADLVIGVDVASGLRGKDDLKSINDIINQTVSLMGKKEFDENKELCDVYIKPNMKGYTVSSFEEAEALIRRGEIMGRNFIPQLRELKQKMNIMSVKRKRHLIPSDSDKFYISEVVLFGLENVSSSLVLGKLNLETPDSISLGDLQRGIDRIYGSRYFDRVNFRLEGGLKKRLFLFLKERTTNRFNVGFHYDDDNEAAVLLNTTFRKKMRGGSRLSLDLKLSENPRFTAKYNVDNGLKPGYRVSVDVNDLNIFRYEGGKKVASYNYTYTKFEANTHSIFRDSYSLGFGGRFEFSHVKSDVAREDFILDERNFFFSYFAFLKMDTHEKSNYPRHGASIYGEYKFVTDNGVTIEGNDRPVSIALLKIKNAIALNSWLTFYPGFHGRVVWGKNVPAEFHSFVGGVEQPDIFDNQLPFMGLRRMEVTTKNAFVFRGDLQFELFKNNYLIIRTNGGKYVESVSNIFRRGEWINGVGLTYSYNSLIGPMEVTFMISDKWKQPSGFVNLGYWF